MSWRTVLISSRCKLDYSMGYMVICGEETARIFILMLENCARKKITGSDQLIIDSDLCEF